MGKGIFVLGTDTDVGKTFVTAGLVYILNKHNYECCSFKAVQTGGIKTNDNLISGDVKFVKDMCNISEPYENMNSYCLKEEVSPHLSSELEGVLIDRNKIIGDFNNLKENYEYVIAEGAGGLIVPIVRNKYYMYHLIKDLDIPVVLVSRAGIGTINHTALTYQFARSKGIDIKGVIINGYNGSFYEDDNIAVIHSITGLPIISVLPRIKSEDNNDFIEKSKLQYESSITLDSVLKIFE